MAVFDLSVTPAASNAVKPGCWVEATLVGRVTADSEWIAATGWIDGEVQAFTGGARASSLGVAVLSLHPTAEVDPATGYEIRANGEVIGVYAMPAEDATLDASLLIDTPLPWDPPVIGEAGDGIDITGREVSVDATVARTAGDTFTGEVIVDADAGLTIPTDDAAYNVVDVKRAASDTVPFFRLRDPGSVTPDLIRTIAEVLDVNGSQIWAVKNEGGTFRTDTDKFLKGSAIVIDDVEVQAAYYPQISIGYLNQAEKRGPAIWFGYTGDGTGTFVDHGETFTVDAGKAKFIRVKDDGTLQQVGNAVFGSDLAPVFAGQVGPSNEPGIRIGLTNPVRIYRTGADAMKTDDSLDVASLTINGTALSALYQALNANLTSLAGMTLGAYASTVLGWADVAAARSSLYSGGIANTHVSASAAITGTKITAASSSTRGTIETATDAEAITGTATDVAVTPANVAAMFTARRIGSGQPATTTSNTTAETTLLSQVITGAAAGHHYALRARGNVVNNTGGVVTYRLILKLGATTIVTTDAVSFNTSALTKQWTLGVDLFQYTDTAHQDVWVNWLASAGSANNAPNFPLASQGGAIGGGLGTVDMTTDPALIVTATMGTASSSASVTITSWYLERVA